MVREKKFDIPRVFARNMEAFGDHDYYPFKYVEEEKNFYIADVSLPLQDLDWSSCGDLEIDGKLKGKQPQLQEIADQTLLIPTFGNILGTRKLHEWISKNPNRLAEAVSVMKNTYTTLTGKDKERLTEGGIWGFNALLKDENTVHLSVIGDCACMGAIPESYVLESRFTNSRTEKGFAEYDLHNVDTQPQLASIYSGLGHIARLAAEG
jgi:hypothetical protein